jgi:hypothetical protein
MKNSITILAVLLFISLQSIMAQDTLVQFSGTKIAIKVIEKSPQGIKYLLGGKQNSDTFNVKSASISLIKSDSSSTKIILNSNAVSNQDIFKPEDKDSLFMFTMNDGSQIIGKIITKTDSTFLIESPTFGKVTLKKNHITYQTLLKSDSFVDGQYWFPNPNSSRYFFSPSAINLKAGEGYYQNSYLFLNSFFVGLTDYLSLGGGFEILELFSTHSNGTLYFLNAKAGVSLSKKFHLGGGVFFLGDPNNAIISNSSNSSNNNLYNNNSNQSGHAVLPYGIATYGDDDNNITAGAGYNFKNFVFDNRPIFTISGMTRVSKKVAFVTENWVIPVTRHNYTYNFANNTEADNTINTNAAYISYGIRFFGEKLSVDFGFINSGDIVKVLAIGIPYVDFVVKF